MSEANLGDGANGRLSECPHLWELQGVCRICGARGPHQEVIHAAQWRGSALTTLCGNRGESGGKPTVTARSDEVTCQSCAIVREHTERAWDEALTEAERRIGGWQAMAEWAATHVENQQQAKAAHIRARAYRRAVGLVQDVRAARQERDPK